MIVPATWSISLDCDCPSCGQYVDLLEDSEFWSGVELEIGEHDTERSRDVHVYCPKCGESFNVACEY